MAPRHFLRLRDLERDELERVLARAAELKGLRRAGRDPKSLAGKVLAMIFEKASTRTRVSFEAGISQLGGTALFLSPADTQLGRGEPIEDTARVLSRMVDLVMIRTFGHERLERFAAHAGVPVINGLSDSFHPCQLLADIQTYLEHRGPLAGRVVAWVGDGNNMANTYIEAADLFDFQLRLAVPEGYEPDAELLARHADRVVLTRSPAEAVAGAHLVVTDTWASMGQEEEKARRERDFAGFRVDHELMARAAPDALFMHCLPAYRGREVTAELLEDPRYSVVWDEAENRLHAQKALMEFLCGALG
ncbi:MAG: ornithine carbamoyltransferase [Porticoccaceae bacterium]|nr:MAG: ornithine carbamoyltransferase [Porticoccaceae bacterium]